MRKLLMLVAALATMCSCSRNIHEGYEYVDLGLSVKWATCNVGASSPEDLGNHFVWGEIGASECGSYSKKHINDLELTDISGDKAHDAARASWGGSWRMPTYKELLELHEKCDWEWTVKNGRTGYKVTGPNGNSIFLPAAGMSIRSNVGVENDCGFYLGSGKSTFLTTTIPLMLISPENVIVIHYEFEYGASIRPVFSE